MESHFGVCLANGPHCLPQPKVIKKKLDMVIIDFAAIAMGLPLSLSRFLKKCMIYPASLLDTTNSVFVTSQDE